jgi:hypothetical protein
MCVRSSSVMIARLQFRIAGDTEFERSFRGPLSLASVLAYRAQSSPLFLQRTLRCDRCGVLCARPGARAPAQRGERVCAACARSYQQRDPVRPMAVVTGRSLALSTRDSVYCTIGLRYAGATVAADAAAAAALMRGGNGGGGGGDALAAGASLHVVAVLLVRKPALRTKEDSYFAVGFDVMPGACGM